MYLEDLEVSSDSDSKSDIEINHSDCTRIFIQPPADANGNISNIDSADEEELSVNNLSGNQLLAPAVLELKEVGKSGRVAVGQLLNDYFFWESNCVKCTCIIINKNQKAKTGSAEKTDKYAAKKKQPSRKKVKQVHVYSW